jgi:hypothetical protein
MQQRSLFGLSEHLDRPSNNGDPLEVLEATVDFECFGAGWLKVSAKASGQRAVARVRAGLDVQGVDPAAAA